MTITRVKLENFTVFESLDLEPSPGINVLVGANGTGKTHLMKVCYAACGATLAESHLLHKLSSIFLLTGRKVRRLVNSMGSNKQTAVINVQMGDLNVYGHIDRHDDGRLGESVYGSRYPASIDSVYIPAKEILSNAPGFRSLYAAREVHFDETFLDILDKAYLPALRNHGEFVAAEILDRLEAELGGKVTVHGEEFFLSGEQGEIEFTMLAEGFRKLGLLWLLIRNGSAQAGDGAVLG